jgi:hypothetical protein
MAVTNSVTSHVDDPDNRHHEHRVVETKPSTRTTELIAYVAAVVLVAITALVVGNGDEGGSSADPFSANDALRYITYLTIGYMIARGLAKSGSRGSQEA